MKKHNKRVGQICDHIMALSENGSLERDEASSLIARLQPFFYKAGQWDKHGAPQELTCDTGFRPDVVVTANMTGAREVEPSAQCMTRSDLRGMPGCSLNEPEPFGQEMRKWADSEYHDERAKLLKEREKIASEGKVIAAPQDYYEHLVKMNRVNAELKAVDYKYSKFDLCKPPFESYLDSIRKFQAACYSEGLGVGAEILKHHTIYLAAKELIVLSETPLQEAYWKSTAELWLRRTQELVRNNQLTYEANSVES